MKKQQIPTFYVLFTIKSVSVNFVVKQLWFSFVEHRPRVIGLID